MSLLNDLAIRFDSWANPVLVKELRQAVQGRFVMGILLLFLLVSVSAMGVYAMQYEEGYTSYTDGKDMFMFFWGALVIAGCALIPINASARFSKELEANRTELLFSTNLSPGAIVRGKLLSAIVLAVLIYTACLPFMTLTYLLRGIDVVSILMMLIYGLLCVVFAVQFTLFIGSFPLSKAFKAILGLILLAAIGYFCAGIIASAYMMLRFGFFSLMRSWEQFWLPVSLTVGSALAAGGLLYVLTVAMITPSSANRALPVRLYLGVVWLVAGGILGYMARHYGDSVPLEIWAIGTSGVLLFALLIGISERETIGPRLRKQIPRNVLLRIPVFFLYSGAAGGVLWVLGIFAITQWILWWVKTSKSLGLRHEHDLEHSVTFMIVWMLYFLGYAMLGILVKRVVWALSGRRLRPTWAITMVLMVVFMVAPPLLGFFTGSHLASKQAWAWYLTNPMATFYYYRHIETFLLAGKMCAGITLLLNSPWFWRQIRNFKPLPSSPPQET